MICFIILQWLRSSNSNDAMSCLSHVSNFDGFGEISEFDTARNDGITIEAQQLMPHD